MLCNHTNRLKTLSLSAIDEKQPKKSEINTVISALYTGKVRMSVYTSVLVVFHLHQNSDNSHL